MFFSTHSGQINTALRIKPLSGVSVGTGSNAVDTHFLHQKQYKNDIMVLVPTE